MHISYIYIYVYTHTYIDTYVCIYIYICIYAARHAPRGLSVMRVMLDPVLGVRQLTLYVRLYRGIDRPEIRKPLVRRWSGLWICDNVSRSIAAWRYACRVLCSVDREREI